MYLECIYKVVQKSCLHYRNLCTFIILLYSSLLFAFANIYMVESVILPDEKHLPPVTSTATNNADCLLAFVLRRSRIALRYACYVRLNATSHVKIKKLILH